MAPGRVFGGPRESDAYLAECTGACKPPHPHPPVWFGFLGSDVQTILVTVLDGKQMYGQSDPDICSRFGDPRWSVPKAVQDSTTMFNPLCVSGHGGEHDNNEESSHNDGEMRANDGGGSAIADDVDGLSVLSPILHHIIFLDLHNNHIIFEFYCVQAPSFI